jgi:hypothetical protein
MAHLRAARRVPDRRPQHDVAPALAGGRTIGTFDAYAARRDAFQETDEALGTVLGSRAAAALEQGRAQERAEYLAKMLGLNGRIGTATGILMARRRWSESQAFEAMALEATWRYARDSTTHTVRAPSGSGGGRYRVGPVHSSVSVVVIPVESP